MSIWQWAEWLEPISESARVTLGEGNTPLVRSRRIGPAAGLRNLLFKLEYAGPTGSYKDRFAASAVSHMVAEGKSRCVATSSGNTGSALAAYCAAAGIECLIAIVEGAPEGKLRQMLAYGAKLHRIQGFGLDPAITTETMECVRQLGDRPGSATQVSSYVFSPKGMSGVKSLSFELREQLGSTLGHVFCPAGGGGLALAVARGFADLARHSETPLPRVEVVQPAGNDTIASALREGAYEAREIRCTSRVSGLQVPNVLDGTMTLRECRASGGSGHVVSDEEVWSAQARLAREEGIFCEPAAATALAGALKAAGEGRLDPDATIVCLVTGSGFKDSASVERIIGENACPLITLEEFSRL
ncbi:MAG: threonine synthase [Planctomycetes bacterium SCN 63-9]|nr:MAG: threonine synthase [Planctomycetes bacterium SCN 63-9]